VVFSTCLLKASIVEPAETAVARERLCKCHVSIATVAHATVEVLLGKVFSVRSMPTAMSPNCRVIERRSAFCTWGPSRGYIRRADWSFELVWIQAAFSLRKEVLSPGWDAMGRAVQL
jgi:hypothetical protein